MSAPVGPTGCEGTGPYADSQAALKRWLVGASYGQFSSELRFDNDIEPDISQQLVVGSIGRRLGEAWSLRVAGGAIVSGTLSHDGRTHDVGTGWLVSVATARQWSLGERWFVTGSLTAGVSSTTTDEDAGQGSVSLTAIDVRIGALVGITLFDRFSPYVLARGFGGPVMWQLDDEDITGTDQHHYQLGAGANVSLLGLNLLVDASLVGERSLSIGATVGF